MSYPTSHHSSAPFENNQSSHNPSSSDSSFRTGGNFSLPQGSMPFPISSSSDDLSERGNPSTRTWNFGQYHPLKTQKSEAEWKIPVGDARPWRMNLAASFEGSFFLAIDDRIDFFYTPLNEVILGDGSIENMNEELRPYHSVKIPQEFDARAPNPEATATINTIKVGMLGKEPVLAAVDDQGLVAVWFLHALKRQPFVFDNEISTWGIALNGPKRRIAVSANSHFITVYDLLSGSTLHLKGHRQNIPSVDFSPSGDRLVSCSVDGSIRLWDLASGACLSQHDVKNGFVWMCSFLSDMRFLRVDGPIPESAECSIRVCSNAWYYDTFSSDEEAFSYESHAFEGSHVVSPTRFMHRSSPEAPASTSLLRSWPLYNNGGDENLLLVTAASGAFLLSMDEDCKLVREHFVIENAVPDPRPCSIVRQFDRLNMTVYCPQLSLCIVASQKGLVALIRLVGGPGGSSIQLRREQTVPLLYEAPQVPLLGLFVATDPAQSTPTPSRAWLYLVYYDGTMMRFLIEPDASFFPISSCVRI
ncbi:hypothetical protein DSO57_1008131 [Entomophthora muscae]|uniref:Uncharacterized protein n=2 Tax=Entomophthora muscae TaxID=34485 RepID=A0ACC2SJW1_9FUNG|nr:hypothetical protein DSO57_1008131 [Entomophthora muscae]